MAVKKCPSCGKKIAEHSVYCIYCATRFDESSDQLRKTERLTDPAEGSEALHPSQKRRRTVMIAVIAVAILLAAAVSAFFWLPPLAVSPPSADDTATTVPVTTTTRDPRRDAWLQSFLGSWVDEDSVGKKDISEQGGALLFVHEIRRDVVIFDLLSYSGGGISRIASISNVVAMLDEDTLHFVFKNDTQNHSGEGYLRFRDNEVDLEVLIDGAESLPEGEHSLAMNTVFKRAELPKSEGIDLRSLTSLEAIKTAVGDPSAPPVTDEKTKKTTYIFGALSAVTREDGSLESLTVDYDAVEDKTQYCYECVDGTMNYDTVKSYFGEAVHDYVEQPTDIRVLYYEFEADESVRFTFDAQDNVLIKVYCPESSPTATTAASNTTTPTETTTAS